MELLKKSYVESFSASLESFGISKKEAEETAELVVQMNKKAQFNTSDYFTDDDGNIRWSSLLVPLGVMLGAGFLGYRSGINGSKYRSAFSNIKNYALGSFRDLVRRRKHYSLYDKKLLEDSYNNKLQNPL